MHVSLRNPLKGSAGFRRRRRRRRRRREQKSKATW